MRILLRCAAPLAALLLAVAPAAAQVSLDALEADDAGSAGSTSLPEEELRDGIVLRVLGLERLGSRAVKATLEVENASTKRVKLDDVGVLRQFSVGMQHYNFDMAHYALIDFENGKKYKVISDAEGVCVCTRGHRSSFADLDAGSSRKLWVQLTPPPLEVTTVSLEIPGATMFDELPIAP